MTESEQKTLFSRFTQATPRTHVKYGGSGLGLFISKSLVTLQGGAIGVSSKSDVGSTFSFFVSTQLAGPPAGHVVGKKRLERPLHHRTLSHMDDMKAVKLHVLIVEDNLVNQKVLQKQLQKCGWTVSVAGDGQEALEWLKRSTYWRGEEHCDSERGANNINGSINKSAQMTDKKALDIILMDVEMPTM
jgi:CheY-like chemotaxis protein